jgi:hypothetical protein
MTVQGGLRTGDARPERDDRDAGFQPLGDGGSQRPSVRGGQSKNPSRAAAEGKQGKGHGTCLLLRERGLQEPNVYGGRN